MATIQEKTDKALAASREALNIDPNHHATLVAALEAQQDALEALRDEIRGVVPQGRPRDPDQLARY